MGKGDRRGKSRSEWARVPVAGGWRPPELAPIQSTRHRQPRAQDGRFASKAEDPRQAVLGQRAKVHGIEGPGRDAQRRMQAPWLEDPLGHVLEREVPDTAEATRLWQVWSDLSASWLTYHRRILSLPGTPKGAAMPLLPERGVSPPLDEREDTRTEEERDSDARASWRSWRGRLEDLGEPSRILLMQAVSGTGKALWRAHCPTTTGHRVLQALRLLADNIEGER